MVPMILRGLPSEKNTQVVLSREKQHLVHGFYLIRRPKARTLKVFEA
jgi:hypothetical protein